jgi:hypothetical protein
MIQIIFERVEFEIAEHPLKTREAPVEIELGVAVLDEHGDRNPLTRLGSGLGVKYAIHTDACQFLGHISSMMG